MLFPLRKPNCARAFYSIDIDECAKDNGKCDDHCHNYIGGYYCSCRAGYHLQPDGTSCFGECLPLAASSVYWNY